MIAGNAANLLSDIKPGYMLGAKPRQRRSGHVIGIFAGALACVPLFFLLFLPADASGVRSVERMISDQFAFRRRCSGRVWRRSSPGPHRPAHSALVSMVVAAVAAAAIEIAAMATKGRFGLSGVSIGLGVVLPRRRPSRCSPARCSSGSWALRHPEKGTRGHEFWVEGLEPSAPA